MHDSQELYLYHSLGFKHPNANHSYVTFTTTKWQVAISFLVYSWEVEAEAAVTHGDICPPAVPVSTPA